MNAMAALKQYQTVNTQVQVFDASPHRLIQMLMEGGLSRLAQAKGAMERGQVALKGELLGKAIAIIGGLREGLDLRQGGELAANLDSLYEYMSSRLLQANRSNDVAIIDEVAGVYPKIMVDGEMDAGAWSCGMVAGLIHDIPTCKELIDRIMAEAEDIISNQMMGMLAGKVPA